MTWTIGPGWTTTSNPFGSFYLSGSTNYISTPTDVAFNVGATFTLEGWFNLSVPAVSNGLFFIGDRTSNNGRITCAVNAAGSVSFTNIDNAGTTTFNAVSATGIFTFGTWNHLAFIRSSADALAYIYLNGNLVASATPSASIGIALNRVDIGLIRSSNTIIYAQGYYSNLRIVKGLAVYTGAFNVPRAPLLGVQPAGTTNIVAITGTQTSLLLNTPNNANFLVDSSANQFTITNTGGAVATESTPFVSGGGSGWSYLGPANGSASFNGSSQYLTTPVNATAFNYASGGMTWEAWVNPVGDYTTGNIIFCKRPSGPTTPSQIEYQGSLAVTTGYVTFFTSTTGGVVTSYSSNITLTPNTWSHVAFVIDTTPNVNIYINGVSVFSAALTPAPTVNSEPVVVGGLRGFSGYFGGYISNFRMVKGVAVYTANFTPPIRQLPAVQSANVYGVPSAAVTGTQTSLLLNTPNNSQNTLDTSTNNFTITNTGSTPPSGINPFVPDLGAVSFNGTSQWLNAGAAANWTFLSNGLVDWTVEGWVYFTSTPAVAGTQTLCSTNIQTANVGFGIQLRATDISLQIVRGTSGTYAMLGTSSTVTWAAGTWYHVAVTYTSATATANYYLNGVSYGSSTATASRSASAPTNTLQVGRNPTSTFTYMTGYMTNLRIVNGVLVYTGAFTPPAQPLPATQAANAYGSPSAAITGTQTAFLMNMPNNAQFIADSSSNGYTVTNNGTALATSLTPFSS